MPPLLLSLFESLCFPKKKGILDSDSNRVSGKFETPAQLVFIEAKDFKPQLVYSHPRHEDTTQPTADAIPAQPRASPIGVPISPRVPTTELPGHAPPGQSPPSA
jgi:hypothetical protein